MKIAIYPGSFDPIHEGHMHIIKKSLDLFDKVIILVSNNKEKANQTNIDDRFNKVKELTKDIKNIEVHKNVDKTTAHWAKDKGIKFLIRSGRNDIDFKYELELAAANNYLNKNLETILIMPDYEKINFESRLIKQGVEKC